MRAVEQASKSSFAPVVDEHTRVLILGTLPGEISLRRSQYYANSRNQFWRLVEAVVGRRLPETYDERLEALRALRIGLWDTVKSADRAGSLDAAIRNHQANPLREFVAELPALQAVAFNGGTAARIGRAQLAGGVRPALVDLPSSSPAFTMAFERKLSAWLELRRFL
jgi:hypoxanthine-DNA glycosylase